MEPTTLILDEPTAGLDPKGRDDILGQIKKLHKDYNMTVIIVSHSMEDVANIAKRVIVMNHGKVALEGTPAEVFKEVDKLESIGLAVPQVTYLIRNSIFTIEEAKRAILSIFASNSIKGDK